MDDRGQGLEQEDWGWGWSRANVTACVVLGMAVLGIVLWQFSGRGHYLGANVSVEQEMVEKASAKIDPNTANEAQLMSLPGIGPALAGRIVNYRDDFLKENAGQDRAFSSLEDLQKVRGIGPKISEKLGPFLEIAE